jgi:hypothetical protein
VSMRFVVNRSLAIGLAVGALVVIGGSAAAQPKPGKSAASREFLVEGTGGAFEVPVHPDFVTVLYFPDEVTKAQASDKENFTISAMGDTISLRPVAGAKTKIKANLNVVTKSIKVTVILRVAATPEDALAQVFFKQASTERVFRKRVKNAVDAELAGMRREHQAKMADLTKAIRTSTDQELAQRMLERHQVNKIKAIERNDRNVIVRAKRVAFVGSDAYLFFDIQNRSGKPYRLARVALERGTEDMASLVKFEKAPGEASAELLGIVPDASRRRGVLVVRDADKLGNTSLTLVVAEAKGKNEVRVSRIKLK